MANPVVAGDHPDPSILRAAGGWYATSTSGDWLPAFPILRSDDLVHWRRVGSVLRERPRWARTNFWAPELALGPTGVLAYYSAKAVDGRRCLAVASAARADGPYSDHGPLLCTRTGEIDPLPVTDEQGAHWLVWKRDGNSRRRPTPILAAPLAPGGMSLAALPRELFRAEAPWEHRVVEAPALVRHAGLLYLLYSGGHCCGRHCNYATGVARSASLLGPWERRPEPILASGAEIRCPGHVGIARGPAGEPLLAYHAYVRGDASDRQLLLARLRFDGAGWPVVVNASTRAARPSTTRFGFRSRLARGWEWPAGPRPAGHVAGRRLVLGPGTLARQTGSSRFTASAVIGARGQRARPGLAVMAQGGNAVGVELRGGRAAAWRMDDGRRTDLDRVRVHAGTARLRVTVGDAVTLAVRARGAWRAVGGRERLPRWAGGAHAALTMNGAESARAQVDSLSIVPR